MGKSTMDNSQHKRGGSRLKTSLALLCLMAASMNNSQANAQEYKDLTIGELSRNHKIESDETKFFKLKIDQRDYDKEKDLIVKVFSEGQYQGDPDVYISRTNQRPNRKANSEWQCSTYGKDTCTISGKEFYANDIFYVGVRCGSTQDGRCVFSIQPTLKGEMLLEDGLETQVDFTQNEAKVFRFYIPANSVRGKDESSKIKSVMITAVPLLPVDEKMSLFASTKGSVNPDQHSRKGTPGWRKGQTLRISDDDTSDWCTDCYIKILLDVTAAGKYQILAKTNVGVPLLNEKIKLDDVSFFGERQCYKYFVKNADTDVNVRFAQFSGIASLTFNPREIPLKFEDAVYKKAEFGNAALVITPRDRQVNATSTGLYYLCVFSHMTATYSIQILETPVNQLYRTLEDGWDEQSEVVGKNLSVFLYKVPPLDFKGQDISIEFQLASIAGETPRMFSSFCKDSKMNLRKCTEGIKNSTVYQPPFMQARAVGKGLSIIIDHDEDMCQNIYNGECYYTIVVEGQGKNEGDLAKFSITSMHSQQNYYVLQEGQSVSDYVSMGSYRYYSFTIPPPNLKEQRGPRVRNITFQLNSLHGDADVFVSRKHQYPNRMDYEKNSVRSSDSFDMVYFDDPTGKTDLTGTYYLGVYSYQYSTYSLVANVERVNAEGKIISFLGLNPDEGKSGYPLVEGVAVRGAMENFEGTQLYRIEIKQLEGYEKAIKIQLSPLENHFKINAQFGSPPNRKEATWRTDNHYLTISTKDPNFKRQGTLYVMVIPRPLFLEQFNIWMTYSFMISYTTEDSYFYLKSQLPLEIKQNANTYDYFRHFLGTFNKDISLSLTVFSGNPVLYTSFDPANKWPQATTNGVISTKGQATMVRGGGKGKALFFPAKRIQQANKACESALTESVDPCVLFASVQCEGANSQDECRYAIKLTYESSAPQPLIIGQPQHNVVKDGSFHYYYLTLKEKNIQEGQNVWAVLQSMKGNADLFVTFKDSPQSSNPDQWELPNQNDYVYKSTQVGLNNQDLIKIDAKNDKNIKDCFSRFNSRYGNDRECALIFGIFSQATKGDKDINQIDQYSSRYNFLVYTDLQQLMTQAPISGSVEQGEFQYYHFESTCVDCTVLISLSTVGNGDPDLFVNFGEAKGFPTREDSHMRSSTFKSEMISIDLNHPYFKANNIKSLKGQFIIGVYGTKRSNYTLVVSQDKHPIQLLMDNTAIKTSQEPFEIVYYTWYNLQQDNGKAKDFRLNLNVKNGQADIYMNTYIEDDQAKSSESQNMLARLPKSKRDTQWLIEGIDSKSAISKKELVVLNNEKNYCTQCFYLIGIVTHDLKTDYTLQIDLLDADFKNAQILRLGETYQTTFKTEKGDNQRVYRFMIDDDAPIQFLQTVQNARVVTSISFSESGENPILTIYDSTVEQLLPEDKNFQIGRMYYIIVKEQNNAPNATHSIMLMQNRTIVRLADGVPTHVQFQGKKDISKLFLFTIPDGSYTFTVQIKTKTESFYPRLYVKYYPDIESSWRDLEFPPGGEPNYFICKSWDYKMGVMNYEERFDNIKGGKAGLAMNLLESSSVRDNIENAQVIITVSATPVIKMVEGQTYIGNLLHSSNYKIYQVDEVVLSKPGYLMIDFTPCIGDPEFMLIDNPNSPQSLIKSNLVDEVTTQNKNGRQYRYVQLPRTSLFIVVRQKKFDGQEATEDLSADFMIKVRHNQRMYIRNTEYYLPNEGKLQLQQDKQNIGFDLKWGHLYWSDTRGGVHYGERVNYTVIATKDPRARLDSQCVMRKEVGSKFVMAQFDLEQKNTFFFRTPVQGEKYYVNVIAKVQSPEEEESELIPYQPIELSVPVKTFVSKFVLLLFFAVALTFMAGALYYYKQSKTTESRLEYEMADVRNVANVTSYNRAIEMAEFDRESKKKSFAKVGDYESISINGGNNNNGVDESQYSANTLTTESGRSPRAQL